MNFLVADLETDGLKPSVIWMIGVLPYPEGEFEYYTDANDPKANGNIADGLLRLDNADLVIGHSFKHFDAKVIRKLTDGLINLDKKIIDTVDQSRRLVNLPDHKLSRWGDLLGFPKGDYNDWSRFNPEMVSYCKRDCEIAAKTFTILNELAVERGERDLIESLLSKAA